MAKPRVFSRGFLALPDLLVRPPLVEEMQILGHPSYASLLGQVGMKMAIIHSYNAPTGH